MAHKNDSNAPIFRMQGNLNAFFYTLIISILIYEYCIYRNTIVIYVNEKCVGKKEKILNRQQSTLQLWVVSRSREKKRKSVKNGKKILVEDVTKTMERVGNSLKWTNESYYSPHHIYNSYVGISLLSHATQFSNETFFVVFARYSKP